MGQNGVNVGIYLDNNNQDNFQLHRFTRSKNIAKFFFWGGATFLFTLYMLLIVNFCLFFYLTVCIVE